MKFIDYNKDFMSLSFHWKWKGVQHDKYFTFPLRTWWKVRKYFKRPRLKFYFGPNQVKDAWFDGNKELGLEPGWLYKGKGIYPFASTEFLKWHTPKWFPVWIGSSDIYWKDKYNEPRYERPGYFVIFFGRDYRKGWQFSVSFETPVYEYEKYDSNSGKLRYYKTYPDTYWDMVIWTAFYYSDYGSPEKPDIKKAHDLFPFTRVSTSDSVHIDNNSKNYSLEWLEPVENILGNDYRVLKLKFNNERSDDQFTKYFDNYAAYNLSGDLSSEYSLSINWNYLTGCIRYSGHKTSKYMRYDCENDELFIYFLDEFDNDGLAEGGLLDLNREGVNIHFTSPLYPIYNKWRIEFLTDKAKRLIYKETGK